MQKNIDYYEFRYPYVYPENNILQTLRRTHQEVDDVVAALTPFEFAFLSWLLAVRDEEKARESLCTPAEAFPSGILRAEDVMKRQTLSRAYGRLSKFQPYKHYYCHDRIVHLLHQELQNVTLEKRRQRWAAPNNYNAPRLVKESLLQAEYIEAAHCLRILTLLAQINGTQVETDNTALPKQGSPTSSIDRIITQAEQLILGRKALPTPTTDGSPAGGA